MENLDLISEPNCIICGSPGRNIYCDLHDDLFSVAGKWSMSICDDCSFLWLNPRPKEKDIEKLYNSYYTHNQLVNQHLSGVELDFGSFPKNKKIKYAVLASHFGYVIDMPRIYRVLGTGLGYIPSIRKRIWLSIVGLSAAPNKKILDLGCGNGDFVLEMKYLGWDSYGLEIDRQAVDIGRAAGLNIKYSFLNDDTYEKEYFDVIHMNNVIEHVYNPLEILERCYNILKPGGQLIIRTSNANSLAHTVFGSNYRGLEIPRHLHIFSPKSFELISKKFNFQIENLGTYINKYIWFSSYKLHKKRSNPAEIGRCRIVEIALGVFYFFFLKIRPYRGDDIFLILKK